MKVTATVEKSYFLPLIGMWTRWRHVVTMNDIDRAIEHARVIRAKDTQVQVIIVFPIGDE